MARHAGFAVAVSIAEPYLNQTLWAALADQEPLQATKMFQLPTSVPIGGGGTARVSGLALFKHRPTITLRTNPNNAINVRVAAVAYVAANTDVAAPIDQDQTWKLELAADVEMAVDVDVDAATNGLYVRWRPASSAVNNVAVSVLEGPGIPRFLLDAINSPATHQAMTAALQAFGPIRITDRVLGQTFSHTQAADFKDTGVSLFNWFTISATISRVAVRVLDGALCLGVDFAGRSAGQDSALVNLREQVGEGVVYRTQSQSGRPTLIASGSKGDSGDIDVLFNADVLAAFVRDVSNQISGTLVVPGVRVMSISASPQWFQKPLRGREIGLCVDFLVNHHIAGDVTGRVFLQPFLVVRTEDSSDNFREHWRLYVGHTEIDVPWWVDVAVAVVGIQLAALFPAFTPLLAIGAIAATDGIIPGAVGNVESNVSASLGSGTTIAPGLGNGHLPTRLRQPTYTGATRIKVNPDGLDMHMVTVAPSLRFGKDDETGDTASVRTSFEGGSPAPYRCTLTLRDDLGVLADDCRVQLILTRADTGAEVARSEGPYQTNRTLTLNHLTEDLYLVNDFVLQARVFYHSANLTGLLYGTTSRVKVHDVLDRRRSFVTWPSHIAYFPRPGDPTKFWARLATATLHRTAASARCLALRERVESSEKTGRVVVEYVDDLGFDFSTVPAHKAEICEYCFLGSPASNQAFPREDWFVRP